jgi:hypothetical protein
LGAIGWNKFEEANLYSQAVLEEHPILLRTYPDGAENEDVSREECELTS